MVPERQDGSQVPSQPCSGRHPVAGIEERRGAAVRPVVTDADLSGTASPAIAGRGHHRRAIARAFTGCGAPYALGPTAAITMRSRSAGKDIVMASSSRVNVQDHVLPSNRRLSNPAPRRVWTRLPRRSGLECTPTDGPADGSVRAIPCRCERGEPARPRGAVTS